MREFKTLRMRLVDQIEVLFYLVNLSLFRLLFLFEEKSSQLLLQGWAEKLDNLGFAQLLGFFLSGSSVSFFEDDLEDLKRLFSGEGEHLELKESDEFSEEQRD